MPNWKKVIVSGSDAVLSSLIVSGAAAVGTSSLGPYENTLTLGARDNGGEGGQLGFNASGGTYASASFIDLYQNRLRILKGTNATSTGEVANWNMHNLQMALPAYTSPSSFPGTAAATLAVDSGGNVITIAGAGGGTVTSVGTSGTVNGITLTGGTITTSGTITLGGTLSNIQSSQLATSSLMIGSTNIALGATASLLAGVTSITATSFTGSLFGTASYATSATNTSDILVYVKNVTGTSIPKGNVVRISGATGDNALISTASWDSDGISANTLGILNETIANDAFGYVMTEGKLLGIDTSTFTAGQLLFLGPTGSIISSEPHPPYHAVRLGQALRIHAVVGSMYVRIDNGYELDELHNVLIISGSDGDLLVASGSNGNGKKIYINSKQLTGSYAITGSLSNGDGNIASGLYSHAEGQFTTATGDASHTEGQSTNAIGTYSHAEGLATIASGSYQHVQGQYNIASSAQSAFIVGNGGNIASRSNLIFAAGSQVEITGSLVVTAGITGSLLGTASYATQALSASWAPGGAGTPTFPYTGSAIISGSLQITGSLFVQDFGKTNIDSSNRYLYDAGPIMPPGAPSRLSIDWGSRTLIDRSANTSIAWDAREAYDTSAIQSINWDSRQLTSPNSNIALNWADNTILNSDVYQRDYKSAATQDAISTAYSNPGVCYLGDVIEADGVNTFFDNAVTEGMLVNLESNAYWYPVLQANARATRLLGIAHNVGSNAGFVLLEGHVVIDDTSVLGPYVSGSAYGAPVYIKDSTTTGEMSTAVPTTTGSNIVRVLGHCYQRNSGTSTQWIMKFKPSNDWVEI